MPGDLSEAELAGLDALVDEPSGDGEEPIETSATGSGAVAAEATDVPATDVPATDVPATDVPATGFQYQAARDVVAAVDGALWRLTLRSVPIGAGASLRDLIAVRERTLNGAKAVPASTT